MTSQTLSSFYALTADDFGTFLLNPSFRAKCVQNSYQCEDNTTQKNLFLEQFFGSFLLRGHHPSSPVSADMMSHAPKMSSTLKVLDLQFKCNSFASGVLLLSHCFLEKTD